MLQYNYVKDINIVNASNTITLVTLTLLMLQYNYVSDINIVDVPIQLR